MEETEVTQTRTLKIDTLVPGSGLLADSKLVGESTDEFFVSTSAQGAPRLSTHALERVVPTMTMLVHERAAPAWRFRMVAPSELTQPDQVGRVNDERVQLLARKYVAEDRFSNEEKARLAITTERVRKLLPAVTSAEYEALEKRLEGLQRISALNEEIRKKLGKSSKE